MNVVLLGRPGSGKGTQSKFLSKKHNLHIVSTGSILRKISKQETTLGRQIKETIDKGMFVSDELIMDAVKVYITNNPSTNGYLFDGFPRNLGQFKMLNKVLPDPIYMIYLGISEDAAISRITDRIICDECGAVYNADYEKLKPKRKGLCDNCNKPLVVRNDQTGETIKIRFKEYDKETKPLVEYLMSINALNIVEEGLNFEEAANKIDEILNNGVKYFYD